MESVEGESRGNSHATISVKSEAGVVSLARRLGGERIVAKKTKVSSSPFLLNAYPPLVSYMVHLT